jgi:hypothetical protein
MPFSIYIDMAASRGKRLRHRRAMAAAAEPVFNANTCA